MSKSKLRVLVLAEAANPEWTSVPLVGWSHALALSKTHDAHLVTQVRNEKAITRFGWTAGNEFTAINTENILGPAMKLSKFLRGGANLAWTIGTAFQSLAYPYFEYKVWKLFKHRLASGEFDVVHRITPVSPTAPSYLAKRLKRLDIPFIVGPLNGGVAWPKQFPDLQKREREWLNYFKQTYKLLPGYRSLRRHATVIIAGSMATKEQLPHWAKDRTLYLPENAIDKARFSKTNSSSYNLPIKAAFVGRLVPYKGADIAIEALAPMARAGKITLDIYGKGPEENHLASLIEKLGLEKSVTLHGFINNTDLHLKLADADIFVFPSLREFGGGVVLEAMTLGVVPIIVDYAGPAELVTENCGYLVPLDERDKLVQSLSQTLSSICEDPSTLIEKRENCIRRVEKFYTWEKKVEQITAIYHWVTQNDKKPDFKAPFPP